MGSHYNGRRDLILDEREIEKRISLAKLRKAILLNELESLTRDLKVDMAVCCNAFINRHLFNNKMYPEGGISISPPSNIRSGLRNTPLVRNEFERPNTVITKEHINLEMHSDGEVETPRYTDTNTDDIIRTERHLNTQHPSVHRPEVSRLNSRLTVEGSDPCINNPSPRATHGLRKQPMQRNTHISSLVSVSKKTLSSKDWQVVIDESKYIGIMRCIEALKRENISSFKQVQPHVDPDRVVTHGDYLIEEMKWLQIDFFEERRWKIGMSYIISTEAKHLYHREYKHSLERKVNASQKNANFFVQDEDSKILPQDLNSLPLYNVTNSFTKTFFVSYKELSAIGDFPILMAICSDDEILQEDPKYSMVGLNHPVCNKWLVNNFHRTNVCHIRYTTSLDEKAQIKEPVVKKPSVYSVHCLSILSSPVVCKTLLSSVRELEYNWSAVAHEIISSLENGGFFKKYSNYIPSSMQWICYSKYLELSSGSRERQNSPDDSPPHTQHSSTSPKYKKKKRMPKKRMWEDTMLSTEINATKIFRLFSTIINLSNLRENTKNKKSTSNRCASGPKHDFSNLNNSIYTRTNPTSSLELSKMLSEINTARRETTLHGCSNYQPRPVLHTSPHIVQTSAIPHQCIQTVRFQPPERECRSTLSPSILQECRSLPTKQLHQAPPGNCWQTGMERGNHINGLNSPEITLQARCSANSPTRIQKSPPKPKGSPAPQHFSSSIDGVQDIDTVSINPDNTILISPIQSVPYVSFSPQVIQHMALVSPRGSTENIIPPQTPENIQHKFIVQQQPKSYVIDQSYAHQRHNVYSPLINTQRYLCYHVESQHQRMSDRPLVPQSRSVYEMYPTHSKMVLNPAIDQTQYNVSHQNFKVSHQEYKTGHQNVLLGPFESTRMIGTPNKLAVQYGITQSNLSYQKQSAVAPAATGHCYSSGVLQNKLSEQIPLDNTFHHSSSTPHPG